MLDIKFLINDFIIETMMKSLKKSLKNIKILQTFSIKSK
jgi:hypothetical protein